MAEDTPAGVTPAYDFSIYAAGWNSQTSDIQVFSTKDRLSANARDVHRTSPYGRSIVRTLVDNMIGAELKLTVEIDAVALGIDEATARAVADEIEREWFAYAENSFAADAQRRQTFTGLMRTAVASYVPSGEVLASVEWKEHWVGYATCLKLIDPERLSDPNFVIDPITHRRMGVERDPHGEPVAYHIRRRLPSDAIWNPTEVYEWDRFERFTAWGRPRVLHCFEADRPDMTRGFSQMATVTDPLRNLDEYLATEKDAAAIRAEYAGVISAQIDYEKAMMLVGQDAKQAFTKTGAMGFNLDWMQKRSTFYGAQNVRFGKAKMVHLLPNEKLELMHATQAVGSLKEMADAGLYQIASGAGVDYSSLTRDYTSTSYSGGRQAVAEAGRSYEVRRDDFLTQIAIPFAGAWLEEAVVARGSIKLPGRKGFYEARKYIRMSFETWGKVLLDPARETDALIDQYHVGATNLREICKGLNLDYRAVLKQRAEEKKFMESLGLKPEDIDPELIAGIMKAKQPRAAPLDK